MINNLVEWKDFVKVIPYMKKLPFELGGNFRFNKEYRIILKENNIYQKKKVLN